MTFFNNWQLNSGNRAQPDILSYFCHHSAVFDWHLSFARLRPICETWDDIPDEWTPQLGGFSWPGPPNHQAGIRAPYAGITQVNYNAIRPRSATTAWRCCGLRAVYLVRRRQGGQRHRRGRRRQIKLNASVGVVVATGDMSTNTHVRG